MADDVEIIRIILGKLQNAVHVSSIYRPVINAAMEEATKVVERVEAYELNTLLACIRQLNALVILIATCAQSILPTARTEQILYPDFVRSHFFGRDFYSELERCQHLFWMMTGESVQSFRQLLQGILPYLMLFTRQRQLRVRDNQIMHDARNRVLVVLIWLRMYPEAPILSALFMISPTTVEREVKFFLPVLWNYFKQFVRWPTHEQWLEMANRWEMFPGAVAVIDGTRHAIH